MSYRKVLRLLHFKLVKMANIEQHNAEEGLEKDKETTVSYDEALAEVGNHHKILV